MRRALGELRGAHAIAAMTSQEPDKLVVARLGHAGGVVVGVGEGEMFVASDMPAILEHTRHMIFLEDGEIAEITRGGATFHKLRGGKIAKQEQIVSRGRALRAKAATSTSCRRI